MDRVPELGLSEKERDPGTEKERDAWVPAGVNSLSLGVRGVMGPGHDEDWHSLAHHPSWYVDHGCPITSGTTEWSHSQDWPAK